MSDAGIERKSTRAFVDRMNNVPDPTRDEMDPGTLRRTVGTVVNSPYIMGALAFVVVLAILYALKPPIVLRDPENKMQKPDFDWSAALIYASVLAMIAIAFPLAWPMIQRLRGQDV